MDVKLFSTYEEAISQLSIYKIYTISIENKKKGIVRTPAGIFVFETNCPHNNANLLIDGTCNFKNEIVCKWHAYRFSLALNGKSNEKCKNLQVWKAFEENDEIGFNW